MLSWAHTTHDPIHDAWSQGGIKHVKDSES